MLFASMPWSRANSFCISESPVLFFRFLADAAAAVVAAAAAASASASAAADAVGDEGNASETHSA